MKIFDSDTNLIFFFIFGITILFYIVQTKINKTKAKETSVINFSNYYAKKSILTRNEMEFYETLKKIVPEDLIILSMVRLADIFSIDRGKTYQTDLNRIKSRHVDFLLCQKETLRPVIALELDDKSHERSDRIKRDDFVNQLFESTGLPLLRYPSKSRYVHDDLSEKINNFRMKNE